MDANKKTKLVSMRLTDAQYAYLEGMVQRVKGLTGMKVTRTSIILKLMEYGLPALERDFPRSKVSGESEGSEAEVRRGA